MIKITGARTTKTAKAKIHNDSQAKVDCLACEGYYNIIFADGTELEACSAYNLIP